MRKNHQVIVVLSKIMPMEIRLPAILLNDSKDEWIANQACQYLINGQKKEQL